MENQIAPFTDIASTDGVVGMVKSRGETSTSAGSPTLSSNQLIESSRSVMQQHQDLERSSLPNMISVRYNEYTKASPLGAAGPAGKSGGAITKPQTSSQITKTQKVYVRGGKKEGEKDGIEVEVYNQGMTKTELCIKWQETGACPYGDQFCRFAHGMEQLRPVIRHPRYKTAVCRMFLAGDVCPYGHRCHFRHVRTEQEKPT